MRGIPVLLWIRVGQFRAEVRSTKDDRKAVFADCLHEYIDIFNSSRQQSRNLPAYVGRDPTSEPVEEYVDLSAELGMEEASKDLAEPWGGKESVETFDEFKDGIGKQLSKEDSETHYNLGIAYMEMELFGEASKEFKIALKDARLEFDCYTRLGLCAMAENNPEEAAVYYSKGLKAAIRSDEEKKTAGRPSGRCCRLPASTWTTTRSGSTRWTDA